MLFQCSARANWTMELMTIRHSFSQRQSASIHMDANNTLWMFGGRGSVGRDMENDVWSSDSYGANGHYVLVSVNVVLLVTSNLNSLAHHLG
jgi:hypothetical protein